MKTDIPSDPVDIRFFSSETVVLVTNTTFDLVEQLRRLRITWIGWQWWLSVFPGYLVLYGNTVYCRNTDVASLCKKSASQDRQTARQVRQKFFSTYLKLGSAMLDFQRITKHDDKAKLSETAAKYEALLLEALEIAKRKAESKPQVVRDILATGIVEGIASKLNSKAAAVSFTAEKYRRTWHTLTPWQHLEHTTAEEEAESIIQTVEDNIHMTETNSWPVPPESHK